MYFLLFVTTNTHNPGYEEEDAPENYYARDYHDDYSPSPPHASGGSYYPEQAHTTTTTTHIPAGFTAHDNQSSMHVNQPPIPPYNPADYANQAPPATEHLHDPYTGHAGPSGYPPDPASHGPAGENVSANNNLPRQARVATSSAAGTPYFPPPPTTPLPDEQLHHENRDPVRKAEEGACS